MRATFMPCSYSGIAQPTMTSSMRAGRSPAPARARRCSTCASSVVGTRRAERAARRLADRRARRGDRCTRPALVGSSACRSGGQFRSGLPVASVCAMRACVFACPQQRHELARARGRAASCSSTRLPGSTSPPHSTRAMRSADFVSRTAEMKPPSRMLTSSISASRCRSCRRPGHRAPAAAAGTPASASARACACATCSSSCGCNMTDVGGSQVAELARLERALRDRRHRDVLEIRRAGTGTGRAGRRSRRAARPRGAHGELLAAAAGRQQPDARLDEPDVRLERCNRAIAMQDEFARSAERHAAHRRDRRHQAVAQPLRRVLELRDDRLDAVPAAAPAMAGASGREIGAERKRLARLPDDEARAVALGLGRSPRSSAVEHGVADRVLLGPERHDADVVAAGATSARASVSKIVVPAVDALVRQRDRESAGGDRPAASSAARTRACVGEYAPSGACTPPAATAVAVTQSRQAARARASGRRRCLPRSTARRRCQPARLPQLERPQLPAEAPADREIDVARVVGDRRRDGTRA